MLTDYEARMLERHMTRELEASPLSVYKCAAGIAIILALSILGPMIGLHSDGSVNVAVSSTVPDRVQELQNPGAE